MTVVVRNTRETQIRVEVAPGTGVSEIDTTIQFLDHMLVTLARYGSLDLKITARGDLRHHLIEDVAIALGAAIAALVPPRAARYGDRFIPMDDALVHVAIDLGGRPYYAGPLPSDLYEHWFRSFADNAMATVHVRVLRGRDRHHIVEAAFKALGASLRQALVADSATGVFSTKGAVGIEVT
ncbi:MAG: imidazoleglycerol-phosphate dehydratase [Gemmatimonadota bacterium]